MRLLFLFKIFPAHRTKWYNHIILFQIFLEDVIELLLTLIQ
jgi:hypothetical protein